ncbi:hypothetical protein SAMN05421779_106248 [Insolitispirillum peregrinum]|uniref:Uncharacterized protein n=2 Tax=Insolitispirillum peregrinum TaxID=80876 RepID=A0A1N7PDV4_9PROT|nr:hypothetical protein SAMN05421779_106248 [Insolitispirillum peregrinum]
MPNVGSDMSLEAINRAFDRHFKVYQDEDRGFYEALHAICNHMPHHRDLSSALAKVAIIGEMYRTRARAAIQRNEIQDDGDGNLWRVMAAHFVAQHVCVDGILDNLRRLQEPRRPVDYVAIARGVLALEDCAQQVAKISKKGVPHSLLVFASKYAQAHAPSVIVIDRIAEDAAWGFAPHLMNEDALWSTPVGEALNGLWVKNDITNNRYLNYLSRFSVVYDHYRARHGDAVTTKSVDYILYKHGPLA